MTDSFMLKGPHAFFQGRWDKDHKKYSKVTTEENTMACLTESTPMVDYCYKTCHQNYGSHGKEPNYYMHRKCHGQCSDLINIIEDNCEYFPDKKKVTIPDEKNPLRTIGKSYVLSREKYIVKKPFHLYITWTIVIFLVILGLFLIFSKNLN